jgi:hypothetical protein
MAEPRRIHVPTDTRDTLYVSEETYKGRQLIDVRFYWDDHGTPSPGKRGISIPREAAKNVADAVLRLLGEKENSQKKKR